jgi:hypothetical protein
VQSRLHTWCHRCDSTPENYKKFWLATALLRRGVDWDRCVRVKPRVSVGWIERRTAGDERIWRKSVARKGRRDAWSERKSGDLEKKQKSVIAGREKRNATTSSSSCLQ